jgi:hypothetical protein
MVERKVSNLEETNRTVYLLSLFKFAVPSSRIGGNQI